MELQSNNAAYFTRWVVEEGLLRTPFVLVDVGVQGGESKRWRALGDHLVLHGFDAIEEVVVALEVTGGQSNRHYHAIAAGNFDGEETLYFDSENPYSSSFYEQGTTRVSTTKPVAEPRRVPVRRLDSLVAQGVIPSADFLKVDVEGYEKNVLLGAVELLQCSLGFEAETAFTVSCEYPNTHFGTLLDIALSHHQRVFDIEFNRLPRASFQHALSRENTPPITDQISVGSPATVNVLFCRNLVEEADSPGNYPKAPRPLDTDSIIKQVILYELYGLNDVALDTVERLAGRLAHRLDVDKAVRLLTDPACRTPTPFLQRINELEKQFKTHQQAYVTEIETLRRQIARLDRLVELLGTVPRPIRKLGRRLLEWKLEFGRGTA